MAKRVASIEAMCAPVRGADRAKRCRRAKARGKRRGRQDSGSRLARRCGGNARRRGRQHRRDAPPPTLGQLPLANGERLPSKAFIYVAGPHGWQDHSTACRRTASSMSAANWIGDRSDCTNLSCDDDSELGNPKGARALRPAGHRPEQCALRFRRMRPSGGSCACAGTSIRCAKMWTLQSQAGRC